MSDLKTSGNILFCGVGGQGILLASEIAAYALLAGGYDIKKSEVHGMAQRGGSVEAHLRYGKKVYSPLIEQGGADIAVSFELLEAMRYLPYMSPSTKLVVNTQRILPPSVSTGIEGYPSDVEARLRERVLDIHLIDAAKIAEELGELRAVNLVLVGALSGFMPIEEQAFLDVIQERVKKDFIAVNTEAFKRGRALTSAAGKKQA